jgi:hypothetical protein
LKARITYSRYKPGYSERNTFDPCESTHHKDVRFRRFSLYSGFPDLFVSLTWMICLRSIEVGERRKRPAMWSGTSARGEDFLDLRGDVPNPRQIDASEFHKLPRAEIGTDPHDPTKEIIYSGTPLMEVLKAVGLLLDSPLNCKHQQSAYYVFMLLVKIFLFGWVILVILAGVYWFHLTGIDPL